MSYRILPRIPLMFRFFRRLLLWDIPGAWRLYRALGHPWLADAALPFRLGDGSTIYIPATWPGMLTGRGLEGYEPGAIAFFSEAVRRAPAPVLIDCGADIGVFARLVIAQAPGVTRVIAYEPNPDPFSLLQLNCGQLGIPADLRCAAVSARPGRASLVLDPQQEHDHGAFLGGSGGLAVDVETIDQLQLPAHATLALKIDVEGEELNVLEGAAEALRRCRGFIVQFEAHPDVMARTGVDPSRCLALLQAHGATRYAAFCERTGQRFEGLTPDRPFFDQVGGDEIYDVIAIREDM